MYLFLSLLGNNDKMGLYLVFSTIFSFFGICGMYFCIEITHDVGTAKMALALLGVFAICATCVARMSGVVQTVWLWSLRISDISLCLPLYIFYYMP